MRALIDTSVLVDHLRGHSAAQRLLESLVEQGLELWSVTLVRTEVLAGMRPEEGLPTRALLAAFRWCEVDVELADKAGELALKIPQSPQTHRHGGLRDCCRQSTLGCDPLHDERQTLPHVPQLGQTLLKPLVCRDRDVGVYDQEEQDQLTMNARTFLALANRKAFACGRLGRSVILALLVSLLLGLVSGTTAAGAGRRSCGGSDRRPAGRDPRDGSLLDRLRTASTASDATSQFEVLRLRQELDETLLDAAMTIDSIYGRLEREQAEVMGVLDHLNAKYDSTVMGWNIAAVVVGGTLGVASAGLQFGDDPAPQVGDVVAIVAGVTAAALGIVALLQENEGPLPLGIPTNLLAPLFGREPAAESTYPALVWHFLETPPAGEQQSLHELLVAKWVAEQRIALDESTEAVAKIDQLTTPLCGQAGRWTPGSLPIAQVCWLTWAVGWPK